MHIRVGIISDLHCHNLKNNLDEKQESYILTDRVIPTFQDPFLSFKHLVENNGEEFDVDLLIMPGDFSNRCCPDGLKRGWDITKEIGGLMKAKEIISTVGNHDVDSRNKYGPDPFSNIKLYDKEIPTKSEEKNAIFWKNGYVILEYEKFRILVINSVHNHTTKEEATHGLFSDESMVLLEAELSKIADSKLGIAICHHNPMEHSRFGSKSKDFMYNGDELMQILDKNHFELIIHGHKHDPMIRHGLGSGDSSVVFSSGSFSAFKDILLPGGLNTFHIINIDIIETARSVGIIDTWFFIPTKGWKENIPNPYFNRKTGFGSRVGIKEKAQEIYEWFIKSGKKQFLYIEEFLPHFSFINNLIPLDVERLHNELKIKKILISKGEINNETRIEIK